MKESDFLYFYIKGTLTAKNDGFIVVENNGIGYKILVSRTTSDSLCLNTEVTIYTHLYIREDVMDLYGFSGLEEKGMFLNLISISGVGPKAALAILSVGSPAKLASAIITNDVKTIQKAPGIGAKIAGRIVLELRDKLKTEDLQIPDNTEPESDDKDKLSEVISALIVLGYTEKEASAAIKKADLSLDTEALIKYALKNM